MSQQTGKSEPQPEVRKRQSASKPNGPQVQTSIDYTGEQMEHVKR